MTLEELKSNIKWWESKRLIYNILVGISGVMAIFLVYSPQTYTWTIQDTLGVIVWGIGANIFYSLGILFELWDWYYLKEKINIRRYRALFFIIGLLFSCLWTFMSVIIFFGQA